MIAIMRRALGFAIWCVLRLYVFVARRPMRSLRPDSEPYIDRYFLTSTPEGDETGTPGWYLQRIYRPDSDPRLHTHPWAHSKSLILRGGYAERRWAHDHVTQTRWYSPLTWNVFANRYVQHRIFWVWSDTWTLFHAGPKHGQGWGFVGSPNVRTTLDQDEDEPTMPGVGSPIRCERAYSGQRCSLRKGHAGRCA